MAERTYLTQTRDAVRVLGQQIAAARRRQRRPAAEVAERANITRQTLRRIEHGDPTVAVGLVFEVAAVLAVPLFGASQAELAELAARGERDLALLPARVSTAHPKVDDDF